MEVKALVDDHVPGIQRIMLYRWLADIAGDVALTNKLLRTANNLEEAELACREFDFKKGDGK